MQRFSTVPFLVAAIASLASAALVVLLATGQPWLGLTLTADGESGVTVSDRAADGPAATLSPGDRLLALRPAGAGADRSLSLRPDDLIEEPDGLPDVAALRELFAHQGRISDTLKDGPVTAEVMRDGTVIEVPLTPAPTRPLTDLPGVFWVQLLVGLSGVWMGAWVLTVRGRDAASVYLLTGAVGLMFASHAAALYSTRELAMQEGVFEWASSINSFGAITFGVAMICLFLVYPVRYLPRWMEWAAIGVFGTWGVLSFLRLTVTMPMAIHIPVLIEMIGILIAVAGQIWVSRANPHARAAMRWFGLSVAIGAGAFVGLIALPQAIGLQPQMSQGHAFAFFLVIYAGLAIGVARYRLFELEFWAFRILFYAGGVALLLLLDALLVFVVTMDRIPAFSISLLVVAFLYLPARDAIARALTGRRQLTTEDLFDLVSGIALAPNADEQRAKLNQLLTDLYHPLEIGTAPGDVHKPTLQDGGAIMDLPGIDALNPTRLKWAHNGRRLFSGTDLKRAAAILQMAAQFVERRNAFEAGVEEERRRINRDMHDNIGVQLLGALHSHDAGRKDALIRQTLTDLREIVSNTTIETPVLTDLLGDIRAEISEHLAAADIELDWIEGPMPSAPVAPHTSNSLRAILREGSSNIIRHAAADRATIAIRASDRGANGELVISVSDNGRGLGPAQEMSGQSGGSGLRNLRQRTEARGGRFSLQGGADGRGAELQAVLPLDPAPGLVARLRDVGE
ncbi:ATP-binding protein [Oceanicola sp. 22II-s10i]|uniref:sensor histidine kinase n=1 Tax=Oceanicola sp. 22II-s10i TaxID=1317116 RepID=UPI000B5213E2|nr:ATP-binding protein [Oceanicola sp. 22II-s10i]